MSAAPAAVAALPVEPTFQMWVTLALIAVAIALYALERLPMELTSLGLVAALLVFFHFFPVIGAAGVNLLGARELLSGFADPALISVLALLVIGQAMVQTGALERPARRLATMRRHHPVAAIAASLGCALVLSAVLNNTPVVVIFIPIMTAIAERLHRTVSGVMMPLSFAAILGGMTTLIGSSTNLLVLSAMVDQGLEPLGFFDFTIPGLALAGLGLIYVLGVAPRLLPDRASLAGAIVDSEGKQFIAQVALGRQSTLVGERAVAGMFPSLPDMTVRMIQRGERPLLPPFEGTTLENGDVIIVAATRKAITEALAERPELAQGVTEPDREGAAPAEAGPGPDQSLAEVVVAPASRMIGRNLEQIGFHYQTDCVVLGIQRRSRMIRTRMDEIRLEAGDVLLLLGARPNLLALRADPDVLLMEWSTREVPTHTLANRALLVFAAVVLAAASDLVPIVVAAVTGAAVMVAGGCLNIRQAGRAVDRRVMLMVGATLALGAALQATGGAAFLAHALVSALDGLGAAITLSAFFLLVAAFTNIISNNATAVLFTPIAITTAQALDVDPVVFVIAVIFAANCSFATPIGYQTNLLVMGPGHYRFSDFLRAGTPLIVILWLAFSLFAPWYYGLG
jgi:di/tricarboxylate transporter